MKLTVGSIVQLTTTAPLEGLLCKRCHGSKIDPQLDDKGNAQDCKLCRATGEPQDGHMDEGCVPVGSDYGPSRGIQPPTKDLKVKP